MRRTKKVEQQLFSYMTERQIKDYKEKGYFWVIGQDRRVYQLRDGRSVWDFYNGNPGRSYNVFAWDRRTGFLDSTETSLLTQLLFLTSDSAETLLETGCSDSTFLPDLEGCPRMRGYKALKGEVAA